MEFVRRKMDMRKKIYIIVFFPFIAALLQSVGVFAEHTEESNQAEIHLGETKNETTEQHQMNLNWDIDGIWFVDGKYRVSTQGELAKSFEKNYRLGGSVTTIDYTLWYYRTSQKKETMEDGDVYDTRRIVIRENTDLTGMLTMAAEEIIMPAMTQEEQDIWENPIEGLAWGMSEEEISERYAVVDKGNGAFEMIDTYELYGQPMKITLTLGEFVGLEKVTGEYDVKEEGVIGKKLEEIYGAQENAQGSVWSYTYGTVSDIRTQDQVKQMYREVYLDPDSVSDMTVAGAMISPLESVRLRELDGYGMFEMNASMLLFFGAFE